MPKKFAVLKPLSPQEQMCIAAEALNFFSPLRTLSEEERAKRTHNNSLEPASLSDFMVYLNNKYNDKYGSRRMWALAGLVNKLEAKGLLVHAGNRGGSPLLSNCYHGMHETTSIQAKGNLFLAAALGINVLGDLFSHLVCHITGQGKEDGNEYGGTGIFINCNTILTCAHVVNDMINKKIHHDSKILSEDDFCYESSTESDLAFIRLNADVPNIPKDIAFNSPKVMSKIVVLGYPAVPYTRSPSLVAQSGEVTGNVVVQLGEVTGNVEEFSGTDMFLFSCIAQPGNSGGPVIDEYGNIIGIVTENLNRSSSGKTGTQGWDLPFFAAVSANEIEKFARNVKKFCVNLQFEDYQ